MNKICTYPEKDGDPIQHTYLLLFKRKLVGSRQSSSAPDWVFLPLS
jgi:hypothetical protein